MNKFEIYLYKLLFAVRLGRKYNQLKCKLGKYPKYMDGRCMWCGVRYHGMHWKSYEPDLSKYKNNK
jgi:hypothetical protein